MVAPPRLPSPWTVIQRRFQNATSPAVDGSSTTSVIRTPQSPQHLLAHMNYARLRAPYDDPTMSEFYLALGPVNALAKATPGFVWSMDDCSQEERDKVPILRDDPLMMPQLSLWLDVDSVQHFAFKSGHAMYLKRKREWFTAPPTSPYAVCWWFRPGMEGEGIATFDVDTITHRPTLEEAFDRCQYLRDHGPSIHAFDFKTAKLFPKPSGDDMVLSYP